MHEKSGLAQGGGWPWPPGPAPGSAPAEVDLGKELSASGRYGVDCVVDSEGKVCRGAVGVKAE